LSKSSVKNANQHYRWFQVSSGGQSVWIREDLVTYDGETTAFGLPTDLYPAPMKDNYWWVRGFNEPPNMDQSLVDHDGWIWARRRANRSTVAQMRHGC